MYAERPWTMRPYAGFAPAEGSNHDLIGAGTTRLDLPTQMGHDGKRLAAGVNRFAINGRTIATPKKAAESAANVTEGTLGEVCDALRDLWGEYQPGEL